MARTAILLLAALVPAVPALGGPGPLLRKPKVDEVKARALVEALRGDPDEKKRKAAADALGGADPKASPDVPPALIAVLRKDPSAAVRAEAAESLRHLGETFAPAGVALEAAVEGDPSPLVRLAARRTLWEYHLNGYRSAKVIDGALAQTVEPPLAGPSGPRPAVALVPAPPPPSAAPRVPPAMTPAPALPQVAARPPAASPASVPPLFGPRVYFPNVLPWPRAAVRSLLAPGAGPPPLPNLTAEPPLAKPAAPPLAVELPRTPPTPEPPLGVPAPPYTPTLPPFVPDLPPVVTPP